MKTEDHNSIAPVVRRLSPVACRLSLVASFVLFAGCAGGSPADVSVAADGEVKTPAEAVARVAELRKAGMIPANRAAVVEFAPGVYELEKELQVGGDACPLVLRAKAAGGGKPGCQAVTFSGGRRLGRFAAGADGIWRAKVPDGLVFDHLFVNGRRAVRAREPNEFYHYILEAGTGADVKRVFRTRPEWLKTIAGLPAEELKDVVLRVWWSWNDELCRIDSVDPVAGTVRLTENVNYDFFFWPKYCTRFTIENARAALDAPGEWFLDRRAGEVLYIPREGEKPESVAAVAAVLPRLMEVKDAKSAVFDGIAFENCGRVRTDHLYAAQSANKTGAAVEVRDSSGVRFVNCAVRHTDEYALWFDSGSVDSTARHCVFGDLGAGGVRIGARRWDAKKPDENMTSGITVDDNIIVDGGHVHSGGTGIFITFTKDSVITHNEICDLRYSGICCGWCWGYGPHPNRNNEISWNHIHHLGKGVMSDMGFVYMLGDSRGSVVCGNHGHDIFSYGYTGSGGTGLYPDEGTRGVLWTSNLVYRTKTSCLNLHYGRENSFVNNIMAFPEKDDTSVVGRWRADDVHSLTASNNVFVWSAGHKAFAGAMTAKDLVFGSNLWWTPDGAGETDFGDTDFAGWRKLGLDAGSLFADPLFLDAKNGDFRMKPESPAFGLGFKAWDYTFAGVRKEDPAWRRFAESLTPAGYRVAPVPPRNPGRRNCKEDFEAIRIGGFPGRGCGFRTPGSSAERGYVRVTDKEKFTGTKALEYRDFKGLKSRYWPHFYQGFIMTGQTFVYRFSFKSDDKANWQCEWREYNDGAYRVGPRVTVQNGKIHPAVDGYVPGEWCTLEFTYHFSPNAASTWDLALVDSKGARHETKGMPCAHKTCRTPGWIGFMSWADCETVTYFEDFAYENR